MVGRIPVRNLWLLMLYASDCRHLLDSQMVGAEENPDELPDLVGELLANIVEHRLVRNLSSGYRSRQAVLNRVRGRIDLLTTERHQLLAKGKVACRFDELTVNTPRNRFVRAALEKIARLVKRREVAHQCYSLSVRLKNSGVFGNKPGRIELSADQIGRNDAQDRQMLALAQLAFDLAIPSEESGRHRLFAPEREERWVWQLFEKAVAGFFEVMLPSVEWQVRPGMKIFWPTRANSKGIDQILPTMRTDIVLENYTQSRRIVIDTKFTGILKKGYFDKMRLSSGYIYQIYAYIRSQELENDAMSMTSTGVLLHPAIGQMVDESVIIQNHLFRFMTVDLAGTALEIRNQLLRVIEI